MNIRELNLFPVPKQVEFMDGWFSATKANEIKTMIDTRFAREAYRLKVTQDNIELLGGSDAGIFYARQTLKQLREQFGKKLPCLVITDEPGFNKRGFMMDITRGRVPTMSYIKKIIDMLAHYKYNQLQLYTEHTFEFSFMESVTHDKSPLTHSELKELDDYCHYRHIELIPCIATFGHMFEILANDEFKHLCELEDFDNTYGWMKRQLRHTIDVSNPESFELVTKMIDEIVPLYRSEYLNICGDETFDLGKGKSKALADELGETRVYVDFLNKVMAYVESKGKKAMYWGDVILGHPEHLKDINPKAIPMHWWYEADVSEDDFKVMGESGREFYACPSVRGWNRLMNDFGAAYININKMTAFALKYEAIGMLHTDWGDFGHINHFSGSLPYMIYGAHKFWSPTAELEEELVDQRLSTMLYKDLDTFALLKAIDKDQLVTWEHLMKWWYEKTQGMVLYGSTDDYFVELMDEDLANAYVRLEKDLEVLDHKSSNESDLPLNSMRDDFEEFKSDVKGIQWFLGLALVIKKRQTGEATLILAEDALIEAIKEWWTTYQKLWLKRNRTSELWRIGEVVEGFVAYLEAGE